MKARTFTRDFAIFVDDLGGLLWAMRTAHHSSWVALAGETGCSDVTLANLANRKTKNPTLYTCWRILRGLDHSGVIRHSQLEQYRGISKPPKPRRKKTAKVIPLKGREAA